MFTDRRNVVILSAKGTPATGKNGDVHGYGQPELLTQQRAHKGVQGGPKPSFIPGGEGLSSDRALGGVLVQPEDEMHAVIAAPRLYPAGVQMQRIPVDMPWMP